MTTTTTTFGLTIPTESDVSEEDLWGGILNDYFNDLEPIVKTARDNVSSAVSSTHTGSASDRNKILLCDATGGAFNVNLLAAATAGTGFALIVKKIDSSANAITIDGNASETIDGETTKTLSSQYQSCLLVCDGTNWHVASENGVTLASAAETLTGTNTTKAITPGGFAGNNSLAASGYYKFPEGYTQQWGLIENLAIPSSASGQAVSFPTSFSSACYGIQLTIISSSNFPSDSNVNVYVKDGTVTISGFTILGDDAAVSGTVDVYYSAYGV
jgi:hypothetical protein